MSGARRILLFDIDGTLLIARGAGVRALSGSFEEVFGVDDAAERLAKIDFAGAVDGYVVSTLASQCGVAYGPEIAERFVEVFAEKLAVTIEESGGSLLPGVPALLEALQDRDVVMGLGTGNFRRTGMTKLDHFGIGHHFVDGGFGEDAVERPAVLAAGVERLRAHAAADADVVVIGDTVHDVSAGRAIGAKVVAVETGFSDRSALLAAGPDVLLRDCSDLQATLDALLP